MKITGASVNKIINIYEHSKKQLSKNEQVIKKDYAEISSLGKSLSSFGDEGDKITSTEKLEKVRMEISKGVYKVDSKLVAENMLNIMKGKSV